MTYTEDSSRGQTPAYVSPQFPTQTTVSSGANILDQGRLAATAVTDESHANMVMLFTTGQSGSQSRGNTAHGLAGRQTRGMGRGQLAKKALGCMAKIADHGRGTALAATLGVVESRGANSGQSVSNRSKEVSLALVGWLAVSYGGGAL